MNSRLLFSDPPGFAEVMNRADLSSTFQWMRDQFETPEDINDRPEKAPSTRVIEAYKSYRKVIDGTKAAQRVGLEATPREYPHFRSWIEKLESLAPL